MKEQLGRSGADFDAVEVGQRIRAVREMRRLSLTKLGEKANVSASFLSQLERGLCNASFGTLRQITAALGLTLAELFDEAPPSSVRVVRKEDRPQLLTGDARKFMLSLHPLTHIEIFCGEFDPGASSGDHPYTHGDSQEFLFVIRGQVTVEVDGVGYRLAAGDTLEYRSSQMHRTSNSGDDVAEVLWIVSPVTVTAESAEDA